jgi:hypothetical protein
MEVSQAVPRRSYKWDPHVENAVNQPEINNQWTLQKISWIPVVFWN